MSDIIHLLPDSIANQIAAGEVIQRPASVVKELVENSIDAGSTRVQIVIKDAGRTLIQVTDNGKGMSSTDLRMAFERHATSKIERADDLFRLTTMGFRGEALASIAAIAHVEVRTKREEDELGNQIVISGSEVESQEAMSCPVGTSFIVKNIFYNIPARRKFLKSNDTEKRNIVTEIERIALCNPHIEISLTDNTLPLPVLLLSLESSGLKQRIVNVVGKQQKQQLININIETSLVEIEGFVCKPENARKGRSQQYFFVNGRYMRHPYFHKAVTTAYQSLIAPDENPHYFIYLKVDPSTIDVNIHPTKTEIKFEEEQAIWQIIMVTIKEALGKSNEVPSIDFETANIVDIPIYDENNIVVPELKVDPSYNPFNNPHNSSASGHSGGGRTRSTTLPTDWEQLYKGFEEDKEGGRMQQYDDIFSSDYEGTVSRGNAGFIDEDDSLSTERKSLSSFYETTTSHYQYKNRYILTSVKSGLMVIDQRRAHVRILFDRFLERIKKRRSLSQGVLFPEMLELSTAEAVMMPSIMEDLEAVGFELSSLGNNTYAIQSVPSDIGNANPAGLVRDMLDSAVESGSNIKELLQESLALSMAYSLAIKHGSPLSSEEQLHLIDELFACQTPNHTPDGKSVLTVIADDEIEKRMK